MHTRNLRNFFKLHPAQSLKLKEYYLKKKHQQIQQEIKEQEIREKLILKQGEEATPLKEIIPDVMPSEKFLSSEHERESDSIRNIIEENDEIYQEINYMETFDEIKDDPKRKEFLRDFQEELQRQEDQEKKQAERKKVWNFMKRKKPIEDVDEGQSQVCD